MPAPWRKIEARTFSLEIPVGWDFREVVEGAVEIRDLQSDLALTLIAVPKSARQPATDAAVELRQWLQTQNHAVVRQPPRPVGGRYAIATTEGAERPFPQTPQTPWYRQIYARTVRRLLRHRPLILWRFWTILNPHLLVLASAHAAAPIIEKSRPTVDRIIASLRLSERDAAPNPDLADSWVAARLHILPTFVPTQTADARGLLHEPWINHLSIAYSLEKAKTETALTLANARRWNIDPETIHQQAIENLVALSRIQAMEAHKADGYTMLLLSEPEKHNAARLLLPGLHNVLKEHLGSPFYAAIPTPELMLAFATKNAHVLGKVRQQIAADYSRAKNGVSPKLFLITPDGIAGDPTEREDWE